MSRTTRPSRRRMASLPSHSSPRLAGEFADVAQIEVAPGAGYILPDLIAQGLGGRETLFGA